MKFCYLNIVKLYTRLGGPRSSIILLTLAALAATGCEHKGKSTAKAAPTPLFPLPLVSFPGDSPNVLWTWRGCGFGPERHMNDRRKCDFLLGILLSIKRVRVGGVHRVTYKERILSDSWGDQRQGKIVTITGENGLFASVRPGQRYEFAIPRIKLGTAWVTAALPSKRKGTSYHYTYGLAPIGFLAPIIVAPSRIKEVQAGMQAMCHYFRKNGSLRLTATLGATRRLMRSTNYCKWALGCWLREALSLREWRRLYKTPGERLAHRWREKPPSSIQTQFAIAKLGTSEIHRMAWLTYVITRPLGLDRQSLGEGLILRILATKVYWESDRLRMYTRDREEGALSRQFGPLPKRGALQ